MEVLESCRICLKEDLKKAASVIKVPNVPFLTFAEVYQYVTGFSIEETGPQNLCRKCSKELSTAYLFKKKCENNEKLFHRRVKEEPIEEVDVKVFADHMEPKFIENWNDAAEKAIDSKDSKSPSYECKICKESFESHFELRDHNSKIHNVLSKGETLCPHCGKRLKVRSLHYHITKIHKQTLSNEMVPCPFNCGKSLKTISLATHIQSFHKMKKPDTGIYICDFCNKKCNSKRNIVKHLQYQHIKSPSYECKICEKTFGNKYKLKNHNTNVHSRVPKETTICPHCGKLLQVTSLAYHISMIHEKTDTGVFICDFCNNKYNTRASILNHMKYQHLKMTRKGYNCQYCTETFDHLTSKRYHEVKVHTKNFKFNCTHCDMKFVNIAGYKSHMTFHSGEKNHMCTVCGMRFGHKTTLKNHIQTHAATKDFICSVCNAAFRTAKNLRRHQATHRKDKFECVVCRQKFLIERNLKVHCSNAHPEYNWDVC